MKDPLLSVCLITYNHFPYIRQAIDSVLMQQVSYSWELVIADDCSTDGTRKILIEYQSKHPQLIKLILQQENVGPARNWIDLITSPKSKYIAYLEGDDYWIDQHKLQKQVDYMEQNQQVSICLHNGKVEERGLIVGIARSMEFRVFSLENVIRSRVLAPSASFLFRNTIKIPSWVREVYGGDSALLFLLAEQGEIHYLPDIMCVYRRNSSSAESKYKNKPLEKAQRDINDYKIYLSFVKKEYKVIFLRKIIWCYFYRIAKGGATLKLNQFIFDFMYMLKHLIRYLSLRILNYIPGKLFGK